MKPTQPVQFHDNVRKLLDGKNTFGSHFAFRQHFQSDGRNDANDSN